MSGVGSFKSSLFIDKLETEKELSKDLQFYKKKAERLELELNTNIEVVEKYKSIIIKEESFIHFKYHKN